MDVYGKNAIQEAGDAYIPEYDVHNEHDLMIDIISTTYSKEAIQGYMDKIKECVSNGYSHKSSAEIVRALGRRTEKLKIYKNEFCFQNIRHLYGTLQLALVLMEEGHSVHLIEAVDCREIKKMSDIDLLTTDKDGLPNLFDYTQVKNTTNYDVQDKLDKLNVLQNKFLEVKYKCAVVSQTLPDFLWELTYADEPELKGYFVDEFTKSNNLIALSSEFTKQQCEELLDIYSAAVIEAEGDGNTRLIRTLHKGPSTAIKLMTEFKEMVRTNGVRSASIFTLFREQFEHNKGKEDYSLDLFETLENCDELPLFQFPLAHRNIGLQNNNPFERLRIVSEAIENSGNLVNPLISLIILSEDGKEHPTPEEVAYLKMNPSYYKYEGIKIVRDKHKSSGELMNSVKLHFSGEFKSLKAIAYGDENTKHLIDEVRTKRERNDFETLEEMLEMETLWFLKEGESSRYFTELQDLIGHAMPDSDLSDFIRKNMNVILSYLSTTQLGSMMSFVQEVATAVCNSPRKKRIVVPDHSGFSKKTCHLSLDCVTDRFAVSLTNMSSTLNSNKDQTVAVAGYFLDDDCNFSRKHEQGLSEWFNYSAADLDWHLTLVHKLLSWLSLEYEELFVNNPKVTKEQVIRTALAPSLIMMANDQKFAQASEMVRYIFVNSTGISGGTKNLYEKINWYRPKNVITKLYMLRMIKMSSGVQWFKAIDRKSELLNEYQSVLDTKDHLTKTFKFKHWKIAFPHEYDYVPSDLHVYNSFYICKAFTVQRHNKILSESLVVSKQLEARRNYLLTLEKNNWHELRFLPDFTSSQELYNYIKTMDFGNINGSVYSPSPIVVLLGGFSTLLRTHKHFDTIGELVNKEYPMRELPRMLKASDIMNTHGSVTSSGSHGVIVSNYKTQIVEKENKPKITKKVFVNQNNKCYATVLQDIYDFLTDEPAKPIPDDWTSVEAEYENVKREMTDEILTCGLRHSDQIWALVSRHISNLTQFVSKMTHKDQIGQREIATLNAASRICCYYVEEFSRLIRDTEHKNGMQVDLIERKDKEVIVKAAFNKSRILAAEGKTVVYDSADCSKWGPSMLVSIMYISLGMRIHDVHVRETVMRCMHLFGNKVYKLPDSLYTTTDLDHTEEETNAVSRARNEIRNMTWPLGRADLQIINLPESMHQGILGVTSSVLGTDMLNLSRYVSHKLYDGKINIDPFCTSDDYTRIITFSGVGYEEVSLSVVIKRTLSIHCRISDSFGIKRNMEKSTHSTVVMEFNSVFYTQSSENRPDIKSRLAYVDFGHSYDPYPNALECLTKGSEFLRSEGSLHGAIWVQLLNTHLSMLQNQGVRLFHELGGEIFSVPLELGGYAKIDPVASVMSSKYAPLLSNYSPHSDPNPEASIQVMMELKPKEVEEVSLDPEDAMKSRVPKMSRSGMVHLCRRDKRDSRKIREYLSRIPRSHFVDLRYPGSKYSMLPALLACMQREESTASMESAAARYSIPQTPIDALVYRVNSPLLKDWLGQTLISRRDLHNAAIMFSTLRSSGELADLDFFKRLPKVTIPFFYEAFLEDHKRYISRLKSLKPVSIVAVNKRTHAYPVREVFVPSMWYGNMLDDFSREFKPVELGGRSHISPQIFLESLMMFQAKMRDLVERKQVLKLTLMESDANSKSLFDKIVVGAFMNGARLVYDVKEDNTHLPAVEDNISFLLRMFSRKDWHHQWSAHGNLDWDMLDERIVALASAKKLSFLNCTNLLNASMSTSEFLEFNDTRSKVEVWHNVQLAMKNFQSSPLVINPANVSFSNKNEVFKLGQRSAIYSSPFKIVGDEIVGREIIQESTGGKHFHFLTINKDCEYDTPSDTAKDVYRVLDISTVDRIRVRIKNTAGFLMLVGPDDFPLQVLCSSLPEIENKVYIHYSRELVTKDIIAKLDLNNISFGMSDSLKKILNSNLLLHYDDGEGVKEEMGEQSESEGDDFSDIFASNDDDGLSFDLGQMDDWSDHSQSESESESEYDDEDSEDELEDPPWEKTSSIGSFISQYGVFQPTSTLLSTRAYGQLDSLPQSARRKLEHAVRIEKTVCINLPFKTVNSEYKSGPTGTGLSELISEISSTNAIDSAWCVSYLRDCLVNSSIVMNSVKMVLKDDEDDEDW